MPGTQNIVLTGDSRLCLCHFALSRTRHTQTQAAHKRQLHGRTNHWRDCHFADALSPSLLKQLLKGEGCAAE